MRRIFWSYPSNMFSVQLLNNIFQLYSHKNTCSETTILFLYKALIFNSFSWQWLEIEDSKVYKPPTPGYDLNEETFGCLVATLAGSCTSKSGGHSYYQKWALQYIYRKSNSLENEFPELPIFLEIMNIGIFFWKFWLICRRLQLSTYTCCWQYIYFFKVAVFGKQDYILLENNFCQNLLFFNLFGCVLYR